MNKTITVVTGFLLTCFFLFSCSPDEESHIKTLEETLHLKLPEEFEIIKHNYEESIADYSFDLILKLKGPDMNKLLSKIESTYLFNQVDSPLIHDSLGQMLEAHRLRGYWVKKDGDYIFNDFFQNPEPISCLIRSDSNTLSYNFTHL